MRLLTAINNTSFFRGDAVITAKKNDVIAKCLFSHHMP